MCWLIAGAVAATSEKRSARGIACHFTLGCWRMAQSFGQDGRDRVGPSYFDIFRAELGNSPASCNFEILARRRPDSLQALRVSFGKFQSLKYIKTVLNIEIFQLRFFPTPVWTASHSSLLQHFLRYTHDQRILSLRSKTASVLRSSSPWSFFRLLSCRHVYSS